MLMSASTSELLTIEERLFDSSHVTPAVRANDTTDIHMPAGGTYAAARRGRSGPPARSHQCGHLDCPEALWAVLGHAR